MLNPFNCFYSDEYKDGSNIMLALSMVVAILAVIVICWQNKQGTCGCGLPSNIHSIHVLVDFLVTYTLY